MADILERKIPYLFPGDLELRLDEQNFVTAISGYPVGGGGGTIVESDFIWKPVINQDGTIGWARDTSATTPSTANLVPHIYNNYWYVGTSNTNIEARGPQGEPGEQGEQGIQGIQGETGPQGPTGADGKSLSATSAEDAEHRRTQVKIGQINGSEQTSFYLPWGVDGTNGTNGTSLSAKTSIITGGHRVEIWEKGAAQYDDSFDVMDGEDGVSPTVTVTNIPADPDDPDHKNGGTEITITDATTTNKFSAWNGNDGTMAGAPGIEGNKGISATLDGSTYKVGLSAGFYNAVTSVSSKLDESDFTTYTATTAPNAFQTKGNYLSANALNGYATEAWVGEQGYLTQNDIAGKADKTDLQYVSAGVDYVSGAIPDTSDMATKTWVGQQNYLTSVPSEYITETELSSELADYIKSISIETGLSGDGVTTALGIDTTAAINFTNATAKSATSAGSATSAYSAYSASYATTAASAYIDANTTSAMSDIVDELHGKSSVTISNDQVVTTNNNGTTATVSAAQYVTNDSFGTAPKQLFVCQDDNDLTAHLSICNGKGTLFFVCSAI